MRRVAGSVAGFHGKKPERAGPFVLVRERSALWFMWQLSSNRGTAVVGIC